MKQGTAYVFINFEQAAGFGHVGWGIQVGEEEYLFGSTDHLWRRKYPEWYLPELIRYMDVQKSANNDFWIESGSQKLMLETMARGNHIRYHAFKAVTTDNPAPEIARKVALSQRENGWNVWRNNCVHQVHSILSQYGADALPHPEQKPVYRIPKVWFADIRVSDANLCHLSGFIH